MSRRALLWALLVSLVVLYGMPFTYLVLTSFKTPGEVIAVPPAVFPTTWTLENYTSALATPGVLPAFVNSLSTAALSTAFSLLLAVPAAYAVTRFGTRAGRAFLVAALVTRMVPPVAIGVPLVGMMGAVGLADSRSASRSRTPRSRCPCRCG
ncbi:carbohydrate ABC transporter permease [Actinokineospora soli]|uniref:Carbohydrate ABC transporter permease n=1 Tax=Actinokineospora soli TaxID=1048753 RepID=A0ABW2TPF5_9PSEU